MNYIESDGMGTQVVSYEAIQAENARLKAAKPDESSLWSVLMVLAAEYEQNAQALKHDPEAYQKALKDIEWARARANQFGVCKPDREPVAVVQAVKETMSGHYDAEVTILSKVNLGDKLFSLPQAVAFHQLEEQNNKLRNRLGECVYAMEHTLIKEGQALKVYVDFDNALKNSNALILEIDGRK